MTRALIAIAAMLIGLPAVAAEPDIDHLYSALWRAAVDGQGCDPGLAQTELVVFDSDHMGARTLDYGVIELDRGLVDFFSVVAASRDRDAPTAARRLFRIILDKAEDEAFPLRHSRYWPRVIATDPDHLAVGRDSRVAFTLAHEIAHLCLAHPFGASVSAAVANERDADRWALELIHRGVPGVDLDLPSAAAAVVEFAMLDGPTAPMKTAARHPVRMARFSHAHKVVRRLTGDASAPYFFEAQAMLTCILDKGPERALERFRRWIANDLVCFFADEAYAARVEARGWCHPVPRRVTPALVAGAMPFPWSVCRERTRLVLASNGAAPMALLRRDGDGVGAARVMTGAQGAATTLGAWIDDGETYRLSLQASDEVVVMADRTVLGRIAVGADGALALDASHESLKATADGDFIIALPKAGPTAMPPPRTPPARSQGSPD